MKNKTTWVYGMMLLAGLMDATTGALLLAAPLWTLDLMGITDPAPGTAVPALDRRVRVQRGLLLPVPVPAPRRPPQRDQRAVGILTMATIVRIFIAGFSGIAIATGALEPAWLSVTFTDATLAVLQIYILRNKLLENSDA
jgi:hypothetical protein